MLLSNVSTARARKARRSFRPGMDNLEGRLVLSAVAAVPPVHQLVHAHVQAHGHGHGHTQTQTQTQANTSLPISITGLNVTGITTGANGVLSAVGTVTGTLAGHAFTAPLTITPSLLAAPTGGASPAAATTSTPILDLQIGAIHLNLLGLKVDTSPICLDISAQSGPGNLLGNLLTDVANLLNGPSTSSLLGTVTNLLNTTVADVTGTGTTSLLGLVNSALGQGLASIGSTSSISHTSTTQVLDLSVAPVNLNLLGLNVHLDNCSNGPITVDISAQPGAGNLLGNLIAGVAHLLDRPGNHGNALGTDLGRIVGIVDRAQPA